MPRFTAEEVDCAPSTVPVCAISPPAPTGCHFMDHTPTQVTVNGFRASPETGIWAAERRRSRGDLPPRSAAWLTIAPGARATGRRAWLTRPPEGQMRILAIEREMPGVTRGPVQRGSRRQGGAASLGPPASRDDPRGQLSSGRTVGSPGPRMRRRRRCSGGPRHAPSRRGGTYPVRDPAAARLPRLRAAVRPYRAVVTQGSTVSGPGM